MDQKNPSLVANLWVHTIAPNMGSLPQELVAMDHKATSYSRYIDLFLCRFLLVYNPKPGSGWFDTVTPQLDITISNNK